MMDNGCRGYSIIITIEGGDQEARHAVLARRKGRARAGAPMQSKCSETYLRGVKMALWAILCGAWPN